MHIHSVMPVTIRITIKLHADKQCLHLGCSSNCYMYLDTTWFLKLEKFVSYYKALHILYGVVLLYNCSCKRNTENKVILVILNFLLIKKPKDLWERIYYDSKHLYTYSHISIHYLYTYMCIISSMICKPAASYLFHHIGCLGIFKSWNFYTCYIVAWLYNVPCMAILSTS